MLFSCIQKNTEKIYQTLKILLHETELTLKALNSREPKVSIGVSDDKNENLNRLNKNHSISTGGGKSGEGSE